MSVLYAILLGIVQGITEFFPVSSFGHLDLIQSLMGINRGPGVLFEVMLHMGTLAAVVLFFFRDIRQIAIELVGLVGDLVGNVHLYIHNKRTGDHLHYAKLVQGSYRKFTVLILVATIPTALLGYQARALVVRVSISPLFCAAALLITGMLLLIVDLGQSGGTKTPRDTTYGDAMWVGICQGIAVLPGFSRSGLTISAALLCGLSRKFAVKFSYILSIPAILGAMFLELGEFTSPGMNVGLGFTFFLGMLVAGITGIFTIRLLLGLIQKKKFRFFAYYCFAAGILALVGIFV